MSDEEIFNPGGRLDPVQTVWILGAGFSRPLGGPLLNELFGPWLTEEVGAAYPLLRHDANVARELFARLVGEGRVANAEEFLVYLDNDARRDFIADNCKFTYWRERMLTPAPMSLARITFRLLLSLQCGLFLRGLPQNKEGSGLYTNWAKRLDGEHAVVTFNYDTLVEEVVGRDRVCIPVADPTGTPRSRREVWLLKMHGSTDWELKGHVDSVEETKIVRPEENERPLIGVPGSGKFEMSNAPLFKRIWGYSRTVITRAKKIVLMGYSMPASDLFAMTHLAECLRANTSDELVVDIVLGPEGPHTERVKTIVDRALSNRGVPGFANPRTKIIKVHPIYAQDYLATL